MAVTDNSSKIPPELASLISQSRENARLIEEKRLHQDSLREGLKDRLKEREAEIRQCLDLLSEFSKPDLVENPEEAQAFHNLHCHYLTRLIQELAWLGHRAFHRLLFRTARLSLRALKNFV